MKGVPGSNLLIVKKCITCGIEFSKNRKLSMKQFEGYHYCSRSCHVRKPAHELMGRYRQVKINGQPAMEHRFLMERKLGRKLGRFEFVHHINGDKFDNSIENLALVDPLTHVRIHQLKHPLTWNCEICGKEFTPPGSKRGGRKKTCSVGCFHLLLSRSRIIMLREKRRHAC